MKLSDLTPDSHNANKGTFRGRCAVERSLVDCGAGRSIVTDKNGVILAGNKTAQAAQSAGLNEEVIVVETDGSQLVVVKRTDLEASDVKAKELAVADNRTAELGLEWDPDVLKELSGELELTPFFSPAELKDITDPEGAKASAQENELSMSNDLKFRVIVECANEQQQFDLLERFEKEGLKCLALTS